MAKTPQAEIKPDALEEGSTTDIAVAMQQHGFSGATVEIKLFKGEPHEPAQPFFGVNNYQIQIQRDKWVRIPQEVADHIEGLEYIVKEADPDEPENLEKMKWVPKSRFPMQTRDPRPAPGR